MATTTAARAETRNVDRSLVAAQLLSQYTVYTKPDCGQCDRTKEYFDSRGITYEVVDVTESDAAFAYITGALGYRQVPVVVNNADNTDHWSGLRRDKLVQAALNQAALVGAH
jgi:glutaredoxin-like protein NrdH